MHPLAEAMPQGMESKPLARRDNPCVNRCWFQIAAIDHLPSPRLLPVQFVACKYKITFPVVRTLAPPSLEEFRQRCTHCHIGFGRFRLCRCNLGQSESLFNPNAAILKSHVP